ncbi:hypothetical protein [Cohnella sp.]|uniref:hypothetical protein n=1 Tax=Cohnella sp. TaxID=1883426 RepID=UPI003568F0CB
MDQSDTNAELRDLYTHQAGATDLHKTRKTDEPVQIDPPVTPTTGKYDERPANQKHGD